MRLWWDMETFEAIFCIVGGERCQGDGEGTCIMKNNAIVKLCICLAYASCSGPSKDLELLWQRNNYKRSDSIRVMSWVFIAVVAKCQDKYFWDLPSMDVRQVIIKNPFLCFFAFSCLSQTKCKLAPENNWWVSQWSIRHEMVVVRRSSRSFHDWTWLHQVLQKQTNFGSRTNSCIVGIVWDVRHNIAFMHVPSWDSCLTKASAHAHQGDLIVVAFRYWKLLEAGWAANIFAITLARRLRDCQIKGLSLIIVQFETCMAISAIHGGTMKVWCII